MIELLGFINYLITLYTYVVIASVIMSWLLGFGVVHRELTLYAGLAMLVLDVVATRGVSRALVEKWAIAALMIPSVPSDPTNRRVRS